jgi:hypothetical protein
MTLQPLPPEFPYIREKFYFLFYQCSKCQAFNAMSEYATDRLRAIGGQVYRIYDYIDPQKGPTVSRETVH